MADAVWPLKNGTQLLKNEKRDSLPHKQGETYKIGHEFLPLIEHWREVKRCVPTVHT